MYGYSYFLVSRGLNDQRRSGLPGLTPYRFEPGEPDDAEDQISAKAGTYALLAAYVLVVALVTAALWIGGGDQVSTEQARRSTDCVHAHGIWKGCLPTR